MSTLIWVEESGLPQLSSESEQIAERLVLLAHYGTDFSIWGGGRRKRYWDALTERVKASTYAGPLLSDWWGSLSRSLVTNPRNAEERKELSILLAYGHDRDVLKIMRKHPDLIVLRVRVIAEIRKNIKQEVSAGRVEDE